jgi:hypothetical protein
VVAEAIRSERRASWHVIWQTAQLSWQMTKAYGEMAMSGLHCVKDFDPEQVQMRTAIHLPFTEVFHVGLNFLVH